MKKTLIIAILLTSFGMASAANITVKGSDTLVRLGQRWAEEYMKAHPDAVIQVSGGGTGTGIAALINGTTDVCEASRDMKEQEYKQARARGVEPFKVAVALDGIAVFLHEANPLRELTLDQLKGIYTGEITNWKQVGGESHAIILYGRENNSGTYAYFKEHVLQNEDYVENTQTLPGTAAVVNAVGKDKYGIGYGGIAWGKGVKYMGVKKDAASPAVEPSLETVTNGTYPISRELYWFFNGQPTGQLRELLNWVLSPEGQQVAEKVDYIPLPKEVAEKNKLK